MSSAVIPHVAAMALSLVLTQAAQESRWSEERIKAWYAQQPWLVGCNFAPSTAINQLEMWQADTFDPDTIERELAWSAGLGFNTARVFLHDIAWREDPEGFLKRMDAFLDICARHGVKPLFVLFDAVWDPFPKAGPQRAPRPHVHNSGWVQSPSIELLKDTGRHDELEPYVKAVMERFRRDGRVLGWDLHNEPGNRNLPSYGSLEPENKAELCLALLEKVYRWAREVQPEQPLTIGVWEGEWSEDAHLSPLNRFMLENSDFISFHSYAPLEEVQRRTEALERFGRPIVCTEYMSRPVGSTFASILPYFKDRRIGAYNWGLVSGKTQTIYPWDSWDRPYTAEPELWFHDIFRADGSPYRQDEVTTIRKLTGQATAQQ